MKPTFAIWFKAAASRTDEIGELAKKYPKVRSWTALSNAIDPVEAYTELTKQELRIAYDALWEWEKL